MTFKHKLFNILATVIFSPVIAAGFIWALAKVAFEAGDELCVKLADWIVS